MNPLLFSIETYQELYDFFLQKGGNLALWLKDSNIEQKVADRIFRSNNGHQSRWENGFRLLPEIKASSYSLDQPTIKVGVGKDLSKASYTPEALKNALKHFHPWRKGPFSFFDLFVDTEWRSDWKWKRIEQAGLDFRGESILDIGCGNGYYLWRMLGAGATLVWGIEPFLAYVWQFLIAKRYLPSKKAFVIPFGLEILPNKNLSMDTVFSMGVLYHRKSPIDHLLDLFNFVKPGGRVILETLVIEGEENQVLVPSNRYAQMRNVWFLPTIKTLEKWLSRCGFREIRLLDVSQTSVQEQRSTEWMNFDSLATFLHPQDPNQTIEGYPAPRRAIWCMYSKK